MTPTPWQPFRREGDRVVCAPEPEWNRPLSGVVDLRCDLFEPFAGEIFDSLMRKLCIIPGSHEHSAAGFNWYKYAEVAGKKSYVCRAELKHVRQDIFRIIDQNPQALFLISTAWPERVREAWPRRSVEGAAKEWGKPGGVDAGMHRHNIVLYTPFATQAEADARIPALLKLSDLVGGLGLWGLGVREKINLGQSWERWAEMQNGVGVPSSLGQLNECFNCVAGENQSDSGYDCPTCHGTCVVDGITHLRITGTDQPAHPAHVRSLIGQAEAAGVGVWFETWGDWIAVSESQPPDAVPRKIFEGTPSEFTAMVRPSQKITCVKASGGNRIFREDGKFTGDCPQEGDEWMVKVGRDKSGNTLDGKTFEQMPEVGS